MLNVMSTAGATVMGLGYGITMLYFAWSLKYGKVATANPWRAYGLEWTIASPPPTENFAQTPIVTREAYDYPWLDHAESVEHHPRIHAAGSR